MAYWRLGDVVVIPKMWFPNSCCGLIHDIFLWNCSCVNATHDNVIKWKHFPRCWPFVRGIHRFPVNSPHKGQCRGALMFSLICVGINGCVNNREAGDLRRYRASYDVIIMRTSLMISQYWFRQWPGAVTQRAITWINVGQLHRYITSLGHNVLTAQTFSRPLTLIYVTKLE